MKNDSVQERIHRLLDGELPEAERDDLLRLIARDPEARKTYALFSGQAAWLAQAGGLVPPAGFTRQVMKRLPEERKTLWEAFRSFLLRGRSFTWNMASALAVAAVLFVVAAVAVRQHPGSGLRDGAVTVRLNFYAPGAERVVVAGDFNRWQGDSTPMTPQGNGIWTVDIPLRQGTYSYMFVVDGTAWVTDPDAEAFQDDGFGNRNAVVRVRT